MDKKIGRSAIIIFIILAFIWGTSFILIKRGLTVFSPVQLGSLRIILTFLALTPFVYNRFKNIKPRDWVILSISGFIGSFFPAYLFAFAQEGINSSTAGILNSLTPLFALLVGVLFFGFKAKWWNFIGIIITFIGTYGLLNSGDQGFGFSLKYGSYIILAAIGYGTQVNIIKYHLHHIPSFTIVVLQFLIISIPASLVLFFSTNFIDMISLDSDFLMGMLYIGILAVVATALALILFYRLVKLVDPVFSASVTYFIPAIATLWGIFDGETIGINFFIWVTIILIGVYIINTKKFKLPF
ncbi:MAG: EamA family transporter [Bacteroidales bacterium]|nr:EamA family transporter [Bacteroidales bacterium]